MQTPRYLNKSVSAYNMKETSYKVILRDERGSQKSGQLPAAPLEQKMGKRQPMVTWAFWVIKETTVLVTSQLETYTTSD